MIRTNNTSLNNLHNTTCFKFDSSIFEKYVNNPEIICFNDCAIELAINILSVNTDFFYSSTLDEFKMFLYNNKKNRYTKNELLALQMLVRYKSDNSFMPNSNMKAIMGKLNNNIQQNEQPNNYDLLGCSNNINKSNTNNSTNINKIISDKNKFDDSFTSSVFA